MNPAGFAGHDLVVLFCPTNAEEAAREIRSYLKHAADFTCRDAWLLIFADGQLAGDGAQCPQVLADPDREAWVSFRDLTECPEALDRADGAAFYFSRGGVLTRFWHGGGHVQEVLDELSQPACERRTPIAPWLCD